MTMKVSHGSLSPKELEGDFESSLAVFEDFFGREPPERFKQSVFWPWEIRVLRDFSNQQISRGQALREWRLHRRALELLRAAGDVLEIRLVPTEGGTFVIEPIAA